MMQVIMHDRDKYRTKSCGERARQQRDRKREYARGRALLKMRDGMGNKYRWEKIFMVG
jgi:hypothetical protein